MLYPHITGDPTPPGLFRVKVSVTQSPMAPFLLLLIVFVWVIPAKGPEMVKD